MESTTITALTSITSSMIGAGIALFAQHWSVSRQFKHEDKKQLQKELRSIQEELSRMCNEILRVDGENMLITDSRQGFWEFDVNLYIKTIRPLIYSKFHLFDPDIKEIVRKMDSIIAYVNHEEGLTDEYSDSLADYYRELIKRINTIVN